MQDSSFFVCAVFVLWQVDIFPSLCLLQWLFSIVILTKLLESKCKIVYTFFVHSLSSETVLESITLAAPVF